MTHYLTRFIEQKMVRPLKRVDLNTVMIIEILTWWAMDLRYISFERLEIPETAAKEVCMNTLISAYKI